MSHKTRINPDPFHARTLSKWDRVLVQAIQAIHAGGVNNAALRDVERAVLERAVYALKIADGLDGKLDGKINKIALISSIKTLALAGQLSSDLAQAMLEVLRDSKFPHAIAVGSSEKILHGNMIRRLREIDINGDGSITPQELGFWLFVKPTIEQAAAQKKEV
ncbi:MAG: hypothetical protein ACK5VE_03265 [Alphaproteobacteria bacterium]